MNYRSVASILLALVAVTGMAVPAMALSVGPGDASPPSPGDVTRTGTVPAAQLAQSDSDVNVTVGQQLSTVIDVSSGEVQTDFENTAFEVTFERSGDERRAEAVADRADELRDRAESIREEFREATEAVQEGELSRSEYARRLAALNARATNLLDSYDQLRQRAANVSALELRAAGVNQSTLSASVTNLSGVTGTGVGALLNRFTGESEGEVRIETENGLSIEVEREGGERSREFERLRDGDNALTVDQSSALETARAALSSPETGTWVVTGSTVRGDEGRYEFAFALRNATGLTGEAVVDVDGSSGNVFALEEEIESRGDEDDEDDEDAEADGRSDAGGREADSDEELAIVVADGTPARGETITVQVLADGSPVENATVSLDDRTVGKTDGNGMAVVQLPAAEKAALTARVGDAEGELEFEFEEVEEDDFRDELTTDLTLESGTVSGTVSYDGNRVDNVSVYANGRAVGSTGSDGTVSFAIDAETTEELELELVKGAFEADLTYLVRNGTLVRAESTAEDEQDEEGEDERKEDTEDEGDEQSEESEESEESECEDESEDASDGEGECGELESSEKGGSEHAG